MAKKRDSNPPSRIPSRGKNPVAAQAHGTTVFDYLLLALPVVVLAILIFHYGVNFPYWDQWGTLALSQKLSNGTLNLADLFAQHNENRIVFPRLLLLAVDFIARGNLKFEMFASLLLAVTVVLNVRRIAIISLPDSRSLRSTTMFLAALLILGPIQYWNWLMGIQVEMFLPIVCLTAAIVVVNGSGISPWRKLGLAIVLATIATYSFSNGMICWILLLPLLLAQMQSPTSRLKVAALWLTAMGINLAGYFYHYSRPADHPKFAEAFQNIPRTTRCFLTFLGAPLGFGTGWNDGDMSEIMGGVALAATTILLALLLKVRNQPGIRERTAPWLVLGGYSIGCAVVVTMGRSGMSNALIDSRYTTVSLYLYIALIFLTAILLKEKRLGRGFFRRGAFVSGVVLIMLHLITSRHGIQQMKLMRNDFLSAKSCLAFANIIDDPCLPMHVDWNPELKPRANALNAIGFINPPLVRSSDLRAIAGSIDPRSKQYGAFDLLSKASNGFYRATGWAVLPERKDPADAVILTYHRSDRAAIAFAIVTNLGPIDDPQDPGNRAWYALSRWEKWFELPPNAELIQAWAYDSLTGHAYLLYRDQNASAAPRAPIHLLPGKYAGEFESFSLSAPISEGGVFNTFGWAVLLDRHKPADSILMTCMSDNSIVGVAQADLGRPDVPEKLHDPRFLRSGWKMDVNPSKLPPGGCELKAWALDGQKNEAAALKGSNRAYR